MTNFFTPRDWQERFVREYQTNTNQNFLLEACTSAGKTAGALYAYIFLKDGLDWRFLVAVVPSEHLKRQYATHINISEFESLKTVCTIAKITKELLLIGNIL